MKSVFHILLTAILLTILVPMTWALVALPVLQMTAPEVVYYQLRLPWGATWYGRMVEARRTRAAEEAKKLQEAQRPLTLDEALELLEKDPKLTPSAPSSNTAPYGDNTH